MVSAKAKDGVILGDRIGVQARSVGGYLRYLGLPYRKIAKIFKDIFRLNITHPSFLAFNNVQAQDGAPVYEGIKQSIRHSPYVNAAITANVIMRKITFSNRSSSGALNQAVIMSIIQTGILNGIEPLNISLALSVKPLTSLTELPKIRSP